MEREQYLEYREKKTKHFMDTISQGIIGQNRTEKELRAMELGFKKGLDTATKGGKFVNQ